MKTAPAKNRLGLAAASMLCLMCELKPAEIRGQCRRCRQGTSRDIVAGRLSEAFLIENGLLLRSRQGRRKKSPPWRQKLEQFQVADAGVEIESSPSDVLSVAGSSGLQGSSSEKQVGTERNL